MTQSAGGCWQGISRIAIVGTWVMAVLAGYGAVSCPFAFISAFLRKIDEQEASTSTPPLCQHQHTHPSQSSGQWCGGVSASSVRGVGGGWGRGPPAHSLRSFDEL